MTEDEYRVYLVKLPATIHGAVRLDQDGFPSIYINDDLSPKAKRDAFDHEMRHIKNDDMFNDKPIQDVEAI